MATRKRSPASANASDGTGTKISQFVRRRPILIGAIGLALGAIAGTVFSLTPEEKQMLGKRTGKLKEQANKLKDSVSALAMGGYDQAQSALKETSEALTVSGDGRSTKSVEENPLIINDSTR